MSLSNYIWILGLAEALAVSLVAAFVFFLKWRRLRRKLEDIAQGSAKIADLLDREIAGIEEGSGRDLASWDARATYLRALTIPFRRKQVCDEKAWEDVLETLRRCFEGFARPPLEHSQAPALTGSDAELHEKSPAVEDEAESLEVPDLRVHLDALIQGYRLSRSTLDTSRKSMTELQIKYLHLQEVNQKLQTQLDAIAGADATGELREELDEARRCSLDLMRAAAVSKRNFNILTQQCDVLEQHIDQLQATIRGYRTSVRELIVERDSFAEETKDLMEQLELRERLVERLRHNYDLLRQEYDKLYGVTQ